MIPKHAITEPHVPTSLRECIVAPVYQIPVTMAYPVLIRYHKSMHRQKGFTLVELLVVIAIIGILSTLIMTNFIGVRQRARDAQRKADLRQIQSALEIYRSDIGAYPQVKSSPYRLNTNACPAESSLTNSNNTSTYMQLIPCDPSGATNWNGGNYYYYSDGTTYTLAACIENTGDTDTHVTQSAPSPAGSGTCGSSGNAYYFVLTNP